MSGLEATGAGRPEISLVVPVYNEEEAIPLFLERVTPIIEQISPRWEMVFVNDGSSDRTFSVLREANRPDSRVKILDFSRTFGKELALPAGIEHSTGRTVVPATAPVADP